MLLFGFELGRKHKLCQAELEHILGKNALKECVRDMCIAQLPPENMEALLARLGGTIKIMEIVAEIPAKNKIEHALESLLTAEFRGHEGKVPFALSVLGNTRLHNLSIKELLNFSKKILKNLGINSRFVNKEFRRNPRPSTIYKARVIQKGIDLTLLAGEKMLYLGKTLAIQNIDSYSHRDYDKPRRDAKIGMLPPKLAQMMINLAGPKTRTIYDPFCGSGTVLMEALLMGKEAIGSDLSPEMTAATQENCTWLTQEYKTTAHFRTFTRDARFMTKKLLPEKVDAIITEGYLGEPQTGIPPQEHREKIFRELANLHLNWLTAARASTPPECTVVMCLAAFKTPSAIHHLPKFHELAQEAGFKVLEQYTYDRPDQVVARDIVVLKKLLK